MDHQIVNSDSDSIWARMAGSRARQNDEQGARSTCTSAGRRAAFDI